MISTMSFIIRRLLPKSAIMTGASYARQAWCQTEVVSAGPVPTLRLSSSVAAMSVAAPECMKSPMKLPSRILLGPGPSNCPPRVLHAQANQVLGHLHPEFTKIMDDVKEGIKYAFQTNTKTVCCISGTGHAGMEATIANLLERGQTILIASNGIWGQRAADMARRQGVSVVLEEKQGGENFSANEIKTVVETHQPHVLFIVQGESSTGVLQQIEGLGEICHQHGALLAVDTVASLGGVPFKMDEWGVDCVYTGSQKVLSAPPSLAPIALSHRAWEKVTNRKTPVCSFYTDITHLANYWGCDDSPRRYHHTGPVSSIYALREALAILSEEGLNQTHARHKDCANKLYGGLANLGLSLYVKDISKRIPTVTTVLVPQSVEWTSVTKYLMERNVEISGGLGPTAGKVWRIGLMGYNCTETNVKLVLQLLKEALEYSTSNKL